MAFVNPQYLVETGWLAEHLDDPDLRIVDCTQYLPDYFEKVEFTTAGGRETMPRATSRRGLRRSDGGSGRPEPGEHLRADAVGRAVRRRHVADRRRRRHAGDPLRWLPEHVGDPALVDAESLWLRQRRRAQRRLAEMDAPRDAPSRPSRPTIPRQTSSPARARN